MNKIVLSIVGIGIITNCLRWVLKNWVIIVLIGDMSFVEPRPDVPGYADALVGEDWEVQQLRPGITGPSTLKYRDEEELLARVVSEGIDGYTDPVKYNDEVIFPDKVRLNRYYLHHRTFWTDIKLILATVLGK